MSVRQPWRSRDREADAWSQPGLTRQGRRGQGTPGEHAGRGKQTGHPQYPCLLLPLYPSTRYLHSRKSSVCPGPMWTEEGLPTGPGSPRPEVRDLLQPFPERSGLGDAEHQNQTPTLTSLIAGNVPREIDFRPRGKTSSRGGVVPSWGARGGRMTLQAGSKLEGLDFPGGASG